MDGLSRVAGIGPPIRLGGREFVNHGRTLEYDATVEAEILGLRANPCDLIVAAMHAVKNEPAGATLIELVVNQIAEKFRNWRFVSYGDMRDFGETPRGDAFQVWFAIGHKESGATLQQVQYWLRELKAKPAPKDADNKPTGPSGFDKYCDIMNAIDLASGDDELGNSTGQNPPLAESAPVSTGA